MKRKGQIVKRPCPWCGRARSTCWVMPCLELSLLLERAPSSPADERRLASWARAAGGKLVRAHVKTGDHTSAVLRSSS